MRIHFAMEGGFAYFPGLSEPVVIDSSKLSAQDAPELQRLVDAARFFDLPPKIDPPQGAADYYRYTVTIEEGTRRHTVRLTDLVKDAELQQLLAFLRAKAKDARAAGGK